MQRSEQLVSVTSTRATSTEAPAAKSVDLTQLLKKESPRLLSYFARRVDPTEEAADLLSQTMIVAWRRQDAIPREETEARMWLFGVARKTLSTYRRGALRRSALSDRLRDELSTGTSNTWMGGTSKSDEADYRVEALREAMESLKTEDRDIIALVHWDGFTLAESARLLHQGPGTTRSRYHRARQRLKSLLEEQLQT
jgi:RNA polymerase sigma-70 factor (ECF subfamily)